MTRFYEATEGKITLDGVDIRELPQEKLRSQMGYVSQKPFYLAEPLLIMCALANAMQQMTRFGRHCGQHRPKNLFCKRWRNSRRDRPRGSNLSGGQKQRLSIARALVRKPAFYLFDDSFSALDYKTDAKLRSALEAEKSMLL